MKYLVVLILSFPAYGADIISQHNEQHAAEQAAREQLKQNGCAWTKTKRLERFRIVEHQSNRIIFGNQLLVECVERTALITWDTPSNTKEISSYEIYNGSKLLATVPASSRKAEINLPLGAYSFHVRSVGNNNQKSSKSNTANLELVNR